jgi:hypothetical protein
MHELNEKYGLKIMTGNTSRIKKCGKKSLMTKNKIMENYKDHLLI